MNVLIIEDEPLAAERLQLLLQQYDPAARAVAVLDSVAETLAWIRAGTVPVELIFMDIQLADGLAFDLFKQSDVRVPVIFTTAYDQYALAAFHELSIDYLLKPITLPDLSRAIEKMNVLRRATSPGRDQDVKADYHELASRLLKGMATYKSRFLGKIGQKFIFAESAQIAFFCAESKIVYLVTLDNRKLVVDYTLDQLEGILDPGLFFRINRSMIVHVAAIQQVKPYPNSRLRLILKEGVKADDIYIARERVPAFKKWADS